MLIPESKNPEDAGIFIREIKAHKDCIVSMNKIFLISGGFVTTSLDKRVRLWSNELDLWGTIDESKPGTEILGNFLTFIILFRQKLVLSFGC